MLPKHLDEQVARFHLEQINAKLTVLTDEQAKYLGVKKVDLTNQIITAIRDII